VFTKPAHCDQPAGGERSRNALLEMSVVPGTLGSSRVRSVSTASGREGGGGERGAGVEAGAEEAGTGTTAEGVGSMMRKGGALQAPSHAARRPRGRRACVDIAKSLSQAAAAG
jgi:hypothetical protein